MPPRRTKPTAPHLVQPELKKVTDATFAEWHAAVTRGFQANPRPQEMLDFDRAMMQKDRLYGYKVGRRWVSTGGSLARELTVPGGSVACSAVTDVTVHPPYRRRGLLTGMMRRELELAAKRGDVVATLWASESMIYGRYGYGPAATRAILKGTSRRLEYLPAVRPTGSCDEVSKEEYLRIAAGLHESMRRERPGTMHRDKTTWNLVTFDLELFRGGASELRFVVHYDDAGDADGFATYRFKDSWDLDPQGEVQIRDLWVEDPGAYASLWRYLLDIDLARSFVWWDCPVDEPLRHLVTDARALRAELADAQYVRVIDVAAALTARRYAAGVDLVIEVDDPILPANSGRYRLVTDGDPSGATAEVTRVSSAPDVSMGILELGTIYLGGVPLADLHRTRRVTEHTPGAVAAASTAFGWHRAPWCPDMF